MVRFILTWIFCPSLLLYSNALDINDTRREVINGSYTGNGPIENNPQVHLRWISQALGEALINYTPFGDGKTLCDEHSRLYLQHLANLTIWAVQMLDSSAQSVSGAVGAGRTHALGNFDQCLDVKEPTHHIITQYCLATIKYGPTKESYPEYYAPAVDVYHEPPGDKSIWDKIKVTNDERIVRRDLIHWALCVPASCTVEDIVTSLDAKISPILQKYRLTAQVGMEKYACQSSEPKPLPTSAIIGWIVLGIVVLTPILSTIYDSKVVQQRKEDRHSGILENLILAFSMRKNFKDLGKQNSNREYDIINGLKVINIILILGGHRLMYSLGNALINGQRWEGESIKFENMIFYNSPYLVDTFFVFGGYLTFVVVYKQVEKTKRLNLHNLILMRWLRIVPAFLIIMMFTSLILPIFSDGPLWPFRAELESRRCRENWWLNILFLNNYIHSDNQCHILSWYLACDMHLFILSCILVYSLWLSPRFGEILCALCLALSCAIPFTIVYREGHHGSFRMFVETLWDPYKDDFFSTVYVKTHNRASPYIVGVIGAYICSKLKTANYKFSKTSLIIGTSVLVSVGYSSQWYSQQFYDNSRPYNPWESALYAGFHKLLYALGIVWIIITYSTNRIVLYKNMFGHRFYEPLARLVYCMVLIHPAVQLVISSSIRSPQYVGVYEMLWMTGGDIFGSMSISLGLYLCVEAPYRNVQKILLMPDRKPQIPEVNIVEVTESAKL